METTVSVARRKIALFVIGALIGVAGMAAYGRYVFSPHVRGVVSQVLSGKGDLALACTPKSSNDELFFVSCGGIY
ncbi:hypothetical protein EXS56_02370 [Candidatus Kaiserbacteria bacterium]|nr:hypothetical protein [Candidatus Kaiserbacteria bacterium]